MSYWSGYSAQRGHMGRNGREYLTSWQCLSRIWSSYFRRTPEGERKLWFSGGFHPRGSAGCRENFAIFVCSEVRFWFLMNKLWLAEAKTKLIFKYLLHLAKRNCAPTFRECAVLFNFKPLERITGIEPAFSAWEADVLPMNYIRKEILQRIKG